MAKYYDIDDISIEEEWHRIPSPRNLIIAPDIILSGFQIETGSKVELPFWLAHELKLRQAVSINVPSCFNQKKSNGLPISRTSSLGGSEKERQFNSETLLPITSCQTSQDNWKTTTVEVGANETHPQQGKEFNPLEM
ncbi:hypothetical protein Fmac_025289 [Flemingia macrophylla]|uniref:DNA replication complex GINS protein PSF3 n=1 Tax=Flemingia macrophylla TaxID=520843 RepID=A0ABD1LRT2_9FABA